MPTGSHDAAADTTSIPWSRESVGRDTWRTTCERLGSGEAEFLSLWADDARVHLAFRSRASGPSVVSLVPEENAFPSLARHCPAAAGLERALCARTGFMARDAPDAVVPAGMSGLLRMEIGPVHGRVEEPARFDIEARRETVGRLDTRLGYAHRGIEAMLAGADIAAAGRVLARACGDSTVAFSFAFARAVEAALGIAAPARAHVIRGVMAEFERIAVHMRWIAATCEAAGADAFAMRCAAVREHVCAAAESVFAHRLMMDEIVPGGVMQNIGVAGAGELLALIDRIAPELDALARRYRGMFLLRRRLAHAGVVTREQAADGAARGVVARAAGHDADARRDLVYAPYDAVEIGVPVEQDGSASARLRVALREARESARLIRGWLSAIPDGPILARIPRAGERREGIAVIEACRGDVLVWVRLDAEGRVVGAHVREASLFHWPLFERIAAGTDIADIPLALASFNNAVAGHDL